MRIKRNRELQKRKKIDDYDDDYECDKFEVEIDRDNTFSKNDLSYINKPQSIYYF